MNNKICRECGSVNEEHYTYCKNCGAKLDSAENNAYQQSATYADGQFYNARPTADSIEGVPTPDMVRFVGKNSYKIIEKWSLMELAHKKTSWCWPVFLLTFFFGLCGAGFWFLYRRMYKVGAVILAVSLALSILGTALTLDSASGLLGGIFSLSQELVTSMDADGMYDMQVFEEGMEKLMSDSDIIKLTAFSYLSDALRVAVAVLLAMFALGLYKSFAANKIKSYGRPLTDMELFLAGGTSGGAAAVGVVFYMIATTVISVISMIVMFSVSM